MIYLAVLDLCAVAWRMRSLSGQLLLHARFAPHPHPDLDDVFPFLLAPESIASCSDASSA
jgi:hypothetical protein